MFPSVTTLPLSTHPFLYTFSPPPYHILDLSSLFCLKCALYRHSVHPCIYLQFLYAYNRPTIQNNQLWLGGSKLHSELLFFICRSRVWPEGHSATNFQKWRSSSQPYPAQWRLDFEPYIGRKYIFSTRGPIRDETLLTTVRNL